MPETSGEVTLKGKVKCPCCGKEFVAILTDEATLEFDMSDYAPDYDEP